MDTPGTHLLSLSEAAVLLRQAHRPRNPQTLRDRIRRGTLQGIRRGRYWYIYRDDLVRLAREPYRTKGGRPPSITSASAAYEKGCLSVDVDEVLRAGALPLETRFSAMMGAQALLFGIKRGQLEQVFPGLPPRDQVIKLFEELKDGDSTPDRDVLCRRHPRAG